MVGKEFIQHSEVHMADVHVGQIIVPRIFPHAGGHLDVLDGGKLGIHGDIAWVRRHHEGGRLDQRIYCWVHP